VLGIGYHGLSSFLTQGLEVLVIQTVGAGDHPAVPLLPLATLVATDEQDGDAPRVKGKENADVSLAWA
jgi:hypothetical protein